MLISILVISVSFDPINDLLSLNLYLDLYLGSLYSDDLLVFFACFLIYHLISISILILISLTGRNAQIGLMLDLGRVLYVGLWNGCDGLFTGSIGLGLIFSCFEYRLLFAKSYVLLSSYFSNNHSILYLQSTSYYVFALITLMY